MKNEHELSEKDISLINKYKFYLQFEKGLSANSIIAYERDIKQFAEEKSKHDDFQQFFSFLLTVFHLGITLSIRIVADFGSIHFQFTMKLKRAIPMYREIYYYIGNYFIHCYGLIIDFHFL